MLSFAHYHPSGMWVVVEPQFVGGPWCFEFLLAWVNWEVSSRCLICVVTELCPLETASVCRPWAVGGGSFHVGSVSLVLGEDLGTSLAW